jgi:hypothetical protein
MWNFIPLCGIEKQAFEKGEGESGERSGEGGTA